MCMNQVDFQIAMYVRKELDLLNKLAHLKYHWMDLAISRHTVPFFSFWRTQIKQSRIFEIVLLMMQIIFIKINIASCVTWPQIESIFWIAVFANFVKIKSFPCWCYMVSRIFQQFLSCNYEHEALSICQSLYWVWYKGNS